MSWLLLYGSWIYNYLCNQCLSPLKLWVQTPFIARCTWYNIMWWSLSVTCDRSVVFYWYSTIKTDHHDITEILLKVALITITPPFTLFIRPPLLSQWKHATLFAYCISDITLKNPSQTTKTTTSSYQKVIDSRHNMAEEFEDTKDVIRIHQLK